jgi:N-acetylglutamate synthase-like GNAT family acetyltransferase
MAKNSASLETIVIREARQEDLPSIQGLLRDSGLPADDAGEHWKTFLVAVSASEIVGTVGLEITGSSGLLRSLAVAKSFRGIGLGKNLYEGIVNKARNLGVRELGLLTTTAEVFFSRAGFHKQEASNIPAYIASSKEYRMFCPSTAVIMTRSLD